MAIADDIAALRADPSKTEKDVYRLKTGSLYDALLPFRRSSYNYAVDGTTYSWTLWDIWKEDDGAVLCMTLRVTGTGANSGAVYIRPQRVFRFVNPPVLTRVAADDRIGAAREMLAGLLS